MSCLRFLPILVFAFSSVAAQSHFDVRDYGARGDGRTIDSDAINAAIDAAAALGGGTVVLPAGEYLAYTIRLKSHIRLELGAGAVLIAADPPAQGEPGGYDAPEPNPWNRYQDFGHSHWRNSLIWGEGLEGVSIVGPGRIYGRGLSRGNGRIALPVGETYVYPAGTEPPDVLAADGPVDMPANSTIVPGPFNYPNARDTLPAGVGNKAIALKNCRNVLLRDLTILHGGHFAILATGVDNLTIDHLLIDTNRDGIDIDACSNVRISNTSVNSPWDDGICLKSSFALGYARATENVTITNCFVSGYDEGTLLDGTRTRSARPRGGAMGRIKFGTEANGGFRNITISNCVFEYCRGIALEQVDGGVLEDVAISNLVMRDIHNAPIFIRLGERLRAPPGATVGSVARILISQVVAYNVAPEHGILILGTPGHPIEDVTLVNLQIHYRGSGSAEWVERALPELPRGYPEPYLFGPTPAWGLFARHVRNLQVQDLDLRLLAPDPRAAAWLEQADGVTFDDVWLPADSRDWIRREVRDLRSRAADGL